MVLSTRGRERRVVVAEDEDGRIAGVAVTARECLDRWSASVLLLDDAAAPVLAPVIDRGPACELLGLVGDVEPIVGHLTRARHTIRMPWYAAAPPLPESPQWVDPPAGVAARLATRRDVRAVARVYDGYEFQGPPTRLQLRRQIRRALRRGLPVLVVDGADGEIVAAMRVGLRTRRFVLWTDATVPPEHRRRRLMWVLAEASHSLTKSLGLGYACTTAPSNPVPEEQTARAIADLPVDADTWMTAPLAVRVRFRGQGRLRRLLWAVGGRRRRRPARLPGDA